MENCTICKTPLSEKEIKKGQTKHYGCKMIKRVAKKIQYGVDENSGHFIKACKTLDKFPDSVKAVITCAE